ncbi:MAG: hypothetical protein K6E56_06895 [Lachnospiraceae bacterium]|nr:hypothetical protein [Lachnospiraceae bacterium]
MRLKYYLRGLGIGIIGAAIILAISFSVMNKDKASAENETEVAAEAAETSEPETETPDNNDSGKLSDLAAKEESKEDVSAGSEAEDADSKEQVIEDDADEAEDEVTEDAADEVEETPAETAPPKIEEVEKFEIMVAPGEYSDTICKKLERAGIIDDATEFNTYLNKNKYDNKLQPGVFIVEKGLSYEELAVILTTKTKK